MRIRDRFSDAWAETGSAIFWTGLITLICGLSIGYGWVTEPGEQPFSVGYTLSVLIWDAAVIGGIMCFFIFWIAVFAFFVAAAHTPPYHPGMETVLDQKVHDTGGLAREAAVDAALRDEDETAAFELNKWGIG